MTINNDQIIPVIMAGASIYGLIVLVTAKLYYIYPTGYSYLEGKTAGIAGAGIFLLGTICYLIFISMTSPVFDSILSWHIFNIVIGFIMALFSYYGVKRIVEKKV